MRALLVANDATQAMQVAVRQVRAELNCDVSWAGLVRGDYLVIGAHDGLHTPEMAATWRLKVGEGIGGKAAFEGRPHKSNYYQNDSRRVPAKRLIDNEGIAATLVVPILKVESSLGVLYAGHRVQHVWRADEITQLEKISHDLAVRLIQLDVDGTARNDSERAQLRAQTVEKSLQQATDLMRNLVRSGDAVSAIEMAAAALEVRIELRDRHGMLVHAAGTHVNEAMRVFSIDEIGEGSGLTLSVFAEINAASSEEVEGAAARLGITALSLQLLRLGERERTTEQLLGDIVGQLLTGRISDAEGLVRRLALIGMGDLLNGAQVLVFGKREANPNFSSKFVDALRLTFPNAVFEQRGNRLVALVGLVAGSGERSEQWLRSLLQREQLDAQDTVVGIGRICRQLFDVSMSYDEARAACEVALNDATKAPDGVISARALGIQGLASMPLSHLKTTVADTLGPLFDSDARKGTEFLATTRAFLANDRHLPATAAALNVHYNTVRNRISRIEELLGVEFGDVDDRFRMETALRMESVVGALSHREDRIVMN